MWCGLLWALLLSAAWTPYSTSLALKETLRWTEAFGIWLIAVNTVRQRWHVIGLLGCVLLAPTVEALLGLYQFATGDGPPSFRIAASLPFVRAVWHTRTAKLVRGIHEYGLAAGVGAGRGLTWWWLPTTNSQQRTR